LTKYRKIPAPRNKLGLFERISLAHTGKRDGAEKRFKFVETDGGATVHMSAFISSELEKFFNFRNDVFKYFIIALDCRKLDHDLIDCDKKENCKRYLCKKRLFFFAEAITAINNEINNLIATLGINDPKLCVEKTALAKMILDCSQPRQIQVKFETRINEIDKIFNECEVLKKQKLTRHIHSKIRLIERIRMLLEAHYRIHVLRLKHYWKAARINDKAISPVFPSDEVLFNICHQTFLGAIDHEYYMALRQRDMYCC